MTNDFGKSKALNMVIKLASVGDKPCVKISDELTKVSVFFLELGSFFCFFGYVYASVHLRVGASGSRNEVGG